ncbi:MAG: methyltransferase domain-containing protein [Gemmatimonadota bacterium]
MLESILSPFARIAPSRLPELMDDPDGDPDALQEALEVVGRANRRAGTTRILVACVARALRAQGRRAPRVLDVGTGIGDLAIDLNRRLTAGGREPRFVLGDLHRGTLGIVRARLTGRMRVEQERFKYVRLTAPTLPFADRSFDFAVSSTMLHHLEEADAITFLRELTRVTITGWAIADLARSRAAYSAMRLLASTAWRRWRFPRHDGPLSVRRAFSLHEARHLVSSAGLSRASVRRLPPFRLLIEGPGCGA